MTTPTDGFLTVEGLAKFASADQDFFLQAATDMVRHFCGWHIAPSVTETLRVPMGRSGVIALPSRYVTAVSGITSGCSALDQTQWEWAAPSPIVTLDLCTGWDGESRYATVRFAHGYDEVPRDVEAIGYELVQQARSKPGGNSKDVGAGPYRTVLLKLGVGLDDDQRRRLLSAGVVRPGIA